MGWYRTPVELLFNNCFCCCQNRFMNGVIPEVWSPIIEVRSLLSSWSTRSEDLVISCFISSSWCSSSEHFSRCICNVSLSLSGAVLATGAESLFCFALAVRSLECEYSIQAVQSYDVGLQSKLQSEGRQNCLFGNMSKPPSSSLYKGSTISGMTCGIT